MEVATCWGAAWFTPRFHCVDTGKTLYILDEPTTGLHFEDINVLLGVLNRLVDKGNTVLVIEHNLDVIKVADHIIDMGLDGGKGGGRLICAGTPEEVSRNQESYTAPFLREELLKKLHHKGHKGKSRRTVRSVG